MQSAALMLRTGPFVLIVERDEPMRALLRRRLERAGYHTEIAASAAAAFNLVQAKTPMVVITDAELHDIAGLGLTQGRHTTPVIACCSNYDLEAAYLAAGCAAFLRKPFAINDLLALIERFGADASRAH